jgi:predicted lipoprotein with Yx(FWY)xxD motif
MRAVVLGLMLVMVASCGGATAPRPAPTASGIPVEPVVSEADNPALGKILVDVRGLSLYFFVSEVGARVVCTGDCLSTWRPLMAAGAAEPASAIPLSGVLGTVARPEGGRQVTYDGWPLYTYSMDARPGETMGNDSAGEWFVALDTPTQATPTPTPVPTAPPPPPPPPPTMRPIPFGNDGDADNRGGPNDGDGNK